MYSDNYILEKDKLKDFENNFSEKKIYEVNDNSNNNYSSKKIKYQLSQLFNLNSLMNFSDSILMIPLTLKIDLVNSSLSNINDIKKLFSIKSGSLISGVTLRVNGEHVLSYNSNLNELIEFNYLTSCYKGNEEEYKRALHSVMDERYVEYLSTYTDAMSYINNNNYTNGTKTGMVVELENNQLLIDRTGFFEAVTRADTLSNERQSYITSTQIAAPFSNFVVYYYALIKLKDIHPFFNSMGISRAFVDFDLDINLGSTNISYITTATSTELKLIAPTVNNSFIGDTNPIYFNIDGLKNGSNASNVCWWKNGGASLAETISFNCKLDIDSNISTKLYVPVYKLKPSINELYIKDSVRTIKYNDYLYYNQNNVASGAGVNFTISNALSNSKYLLIVPQLLRNKASPFNSSLLLNGPLSLQNLQINKGGALFNTNLVYSYDMFLNYIENVNNVNGGRDWLNNLISFEKWNKMYRLYFFDLTLLNNEKDVAYNLTVQYTNNNRLAINVDYYIFEEKDLIMNKLNGRLGQIE